MGGTASSLSRAENGEPGEIFSSQLERAAFEKIVGELPVPREDVAYTTLFNTAKPLTHLSQRQVEFLNHEYGATLAENSLQSGNFRVLVRFVIHSLPICFRMEKMTPEDLDAIMPAGTVAGSPVASLGPVPASPRDPGVGSPDGSSASGSKRGVVDTQLHQTVNALFLVRNFAMRFIEKQDECALLAHFNHIQQPDFTATVSPTGRRSSAIRVTEPSYVRQPSGLQDDLGFRFLETLLTGLIDFEPTPKTHDLHVEILNTLLVLLTPVAFPRDHSKDVDDLSASNPFLHMLLASSLPGAHKSFWGVGVVSRLLHNYMDPLEAPPTARGTLAVQRAAKNAEDTSLIKISENMDAATVEDAEQFSYLTLEGIGSLASTIFRFPLSFYHYFVSPDGHTYPLADRSALLILILMQSSRDSDALENPFRNVLCSITDTEQTAGDAMTVQAAQQSRPSAMSISFSRLFAAVGRKAPYETSHLMLYTFMYTNPMMLETAITTCDVDHVMLPLLETLYHAKAVDPSRIYMLVIVLLTYTQDAAFVRDAHTKVMVQKVPWYSERYILDVSLGSLMMVIFTRVIYRNITHFQDSFIHLNAFAALSNLARYAENVHVYAAQSIVGLIEMLAKMEAKFSAKVERGQQAMSEELAQKRSAYVEFIRLLLGVTSSCLKPNLLPRNPQLIYSLLYRAETFSTLQQHPEFAHQVNNWSVWSTLSKFQTLVESKTMPEDNLEVHVVLDIIKAECVSLLASTASTTYGRRRGSYGMDNAHSNGNMAPDADEDDASYRYEEESDPEQFFVPYIWKLVFEQTPEFCWKVEKITLFTPTRTTTTVVTE